MTGEPMNEKDPKEDNNSNLPASSRAQVDEGKQLTANDIKVDPEIERLFPKLSDLQYQALKESIREEGQHVPIYVNADGVILDGHNRYRACCELGITPKFEVIRFKDEIQEQRFLATVNLVRRNLNPYQAIELALQGAAIEIELARKRQLQHLRKGNDGQQQSPATIYVPVSPPLSSPSVEIYTSGETEAGTAGRVNEKLAARAGVSPSTFARGKYIAEHAPEAVKQALREGLMHIDSAYKTLRTAKGTEEEEETEEDEEKEKETAEPLQVKEQEYSFDLDETLLNLSIMAYHKSCSPDLIVPSWRFANQDTDDLMLLTYIASIARNCLASGKYLALYVDQASIGYVLTLIQGQQAGLEYSHCMAVEVDKVVDSTGREQTGDVADFVLVFRKHLSTEEKDEEGEEPPFIPSIIRISAGRIEGMDDRDQGLTRAVEFLTKHLTKEGAEVCDPVGSIPAFHRTVTTLKRKFVEQEDWSWFK